MKILYVITKSNWGGAQRYVYDLATRLPKDQFEVVVAAGGEGVLMERLKSAGVRTVTIKSLQRDVRIVKEIVSICSLFKIFKNERPDIIHLNSSKAGVLGAAAARATKLLTKNYKLKTIFTAHGWGFNEDRPYIIRLIIFALQWIGILFCDFVICVSRSVFNQGMYFPSASKKLRMIDLGAREPDFLDKAEARMTLSRMDKTGALNPEFQWVGCVAELTKNKGLPYLIDAANQVKSQFSMTNFQLLILGEGEDRGKLENLITKYKLQTTVLLLGFVPEAAKYLKAFDIFALPSLTEAGVYALHEAGLSGLPVVATKVGGIPYIIEDQKTGFLVPKKDAGVLAEAIKKLLKSPELRSEMGLTNREIILQKFSFEKMLKETIDIYMG